jgi:hypothetical protein
MSVNSYANNLDSAVRYALETPVPQRFAFFTRM